MKKILLSVIVAVTTAFNSSAQCHLIPSTSTSTDTLSYIFSGGGFASFGCAPIDPTYWMAGNGMNVTITFVNPESYPSFRVWGMNTDDSASVMVNGANYPLTSSSATYNSKVVCGLSPGPDGVIFSAGKLVGANTPAQGNFSYQDVQLNTTSVTSITLTGISGAGWGFAGTLVDCPQTVGINNIYSTTNIIAVYPNPVKNQLLFSVTSNVWLSNLTGQIIINRKNINKLDLSDLPIGVYFISFTDIHGKVIQRNKIVKE